MTFQENVNFGGYQALTKIVSIGNAKQLELALKRHEQETDPIKANKLLCMAVVDFIDTPPDDFFGSDDFPISILWGAVDFFLAHLEKAKK